MGIGSVDLLGGVGRPDEAALHVIGEVLVYGFSRHVPC